MLGTNYSMSERQVKRCPNLFLDAFIIVSRGITARRGPGFYFHS